MSTTKRIAIYGGTFNPPHMGHVTAALGVQKELEADKLILMPAWLSPGKIQKEGDPIPEERLEMCRLSFASVPRCEVSDIEIRREEKSYTADTLLELRKQYPDAEFTLIVGSDMLDHLPKWARIETIIKECSSLAILVRVDAEPEDVRKRAEELETLLGGHFHVLGHKALGVSSTVVREKLFEEEGRRLMEPATMEYICSNGLYQKA